MKKKIKKFINILVKYRKKIIVGLFIVFGIELLLMGYFVFVKQVFQEEKVEEKEGIREEEIKVDLVDYKITNKATLYEKELFEELEEILSKDEIDYEMYANVLVKLFIADLYTLNNKKSSSDIRSSQYVYSDYQETFKLMVKESLYSNIELDLDGTRTQKLPEVSEVVVNSITRESFSYNNQIIDNEAYNVNITVNYKEDLGYARSGKVIVVKKDNILEVVKLEM